MSVPEAARPTSEPMFPNEPTISRSNPTRTRQGATVLNFPDGVELRRYDDGTYKLGAWDHLVVVEDMRNYNPGNSRGSGYIKVFFSAIEQEDEGGQPDA